MFEAFQKPCRSRTVSDVLPPRTVSDTIHECFCSKFCCVVPDLARVPERFTIADDPCSRAFHTRLVVGLQRPVLSLDVLIGLAALVACRTTCEALDLARRAPLTRAFLTTRELACRALHLSVRDLVRLFVDAHPQLQSRLHLVTEGSLWFILKFAGRANLALHKVVVVRVRRNGAVGALSNADIDEATGDTVYAGARALAPTVLTGAISAAHRAQFARELSFQILILPVLLSTGFA